MVGESLLATPRQPGRQAQSNPLSACAWGKGRSERLRLEEVLTGPVAPVEAMTWESSKVPGWWVVWLHTASATGDCRQRQTLRPATGGRSSTSALLVHDELAGLRTWDSIG